MDGALNRGLGQKHLPKHTSNLNSQNIKLFLSLQAASIPTELLASYTTLDRFLDKVDVV
jgi:hypothetical protein